MNAHTETPFPLTTQSTEEDSPLNKAMNHYLFSYGTLQKQQVQIDLFGRVLEGWPDILKNYKVSPIEITDEAFLAKGEEKSQLTATPSADKKHSIQGTVFEVNEEELLYADKYEPAGYKRILVRLASGKKAWLYVFVETTS